MALPEVVQGSKLWILEVGLKAIAGDAKVSRFAVARAEAPTELLCLKAGAVEVSGLTRCGYGKSSDNVVEGNGRRCQGIQTFSGQGMYLDSAAVAGASMTCGGQPICHGQVFGLYSAVAGDGRKRHQDVWTRCGQGKGSDSVVAGDERNAEVSRFTVVRTRAQAVLLWQAVAKDANLPGDNLASVRSDTLIFI